jgi:RNA polymerase sigma factor FliA
VKNQQTIVDEKIVTSEILLERKKMFLKHVGLVGYVVHKLMGFHQQAEKAIEKADLIQYGMMGLMDAVERYDASRGIQFQTYAVSRIRGTIQDELRKLDWKPRSTRERERKQDSMIQQVQTSNSGGESVEEIIERLSMTMEEYQQVIERAETATLSDSIPLNTENPSLNSIAADENENPAELLQQKQLREMIFEAIEKLPDRDRIVLILYYYEELTFKEIARILKISESRVFQVHATVLQQIRQRIQNEERGMVA